MGLDALRIEQRDAVTVLHVDDGKVTVGVGTQTESLPGIPGTGSNGFLPSWAGALKESATMLNAIANSTRRRTVIKQRLPGEVVMR
jgi:hypothetical protein